MRRLRHRRLKNSQEAPQLESGRAGIWTETTWLPGRCAHLCAQAGASPPRALQTPGPPTHRKAWSVEKALGWQHQAHGPSAGLPLHSFLALLPWPIALDNRPVTLAWATWLLTFSLPEERGGSWCSSPGTRITQIQSPQTPSSWSSWGDWPGNGSVPQTGCPGHSAGLWNTEEGNCPCPDSLSHCSWQKRTLGTKKVAQSSGRRHPHNCVPSEGPNLSRIDPCDPYWWRKLSKTLKVITGMILPLQ